MMFPEAESNLNNHSPAPDHLRTGPQREALIRADIRWRKPTQRKAAQRRLFISRLVGLAQAIKADFDIRR